LRDVQTATTRFGGQEWSDWGERHGRQSREATVERSRKLPRYKTPSDLRRAIAQEQQIREWERAFTR
jgi:hypothetical protein